VKSEFQDVRPCFSSRQRAIRVNSFVFVATISNNNLREFLNRTGWDGATGEPITGDASARKYHRLHRNHQSAVLMDASQNLESIAPFIGINLHLQQLGFSVPAILNQDDKNGFLLLEDFGDNTFARLLDNQGDAEQLYALATDVLIALHQNPRAIPAGLRAYHPEKMLSDIELFLEWCTPKISPAGKDEFRTVWREVLPLAHQVPASLLLRDYHVANLMLLPGREGIRQAGLLDFQDAYQGPITYDLVSLLEDARRDVPDELKDKMVARYLAGSPALDQKAFETSLAILAALRHTRVLAIFERLSRHEGKPDYKKLHSPRVERRLQRALRHPTLAGVKRWMEHYAR
jgi:aminoglycoside/choline kinase family phosphotransferase